MSGTGIRDELADGVLTITLDREAKRNALHPPAQLRLVELLEAAAVEHALLSAGKASARF